MGDLVFLCRRGQNFQHVRGLVQCPNCSWSSGWFGPGNTPDGDPFVYEGSRVLCPRGCNVQLLVHPAKAATP